MSSFRRVAGRFFRKQREKVGARWFCGRRRGGRVDSDGGGVIFGERLGLDRPRTGVWAGQATVGRYPRSSRRKEFTVRCGAFGLYGETFSFRRGGVCLLGGWIDLLDRRIDVGRAATACNFSGPGAGCRPGPRSATIRRQLPRQLSKWCRRQAKVARIGQAAKYRPARFQRQRTGMNPIERGRTVRGRREHWPDVCWGWRPTRWRHDMDHALALGTFQNGPDCRLGTHHEPGLAGRTSNRENRLFHGSAGWREGVNCPVSAYRLFYDICGPMSLGCSPGT